MLTNPAADPLPQCVCNDPAYNDLIDVVGPIFPQIYDTFKLNGFGLYPHYIPNKTSEITWAWWGFLKEMRTMPDNKNEFKLEMKLCYACPKSN